MKLYRHNQIAYQNAKEMLEKEERCCIVQATGTGKSYVTLSLIIDLVRENPSAVVEYIVPSRNIINEVHEILRVEKMEHLLDNITFRTYHAITEEKLADKEDVKYDLLILDEFHHIGQTAPIWKAGIKKIINNNPHKKVFGMSATPIRKNGRTSEEDVSLTLFNGNIANTFTLVDALYENVLPFPKYISSILCLLDEVKSTEKTLLLMYLDTQRKEALLNKIQLIKEKLLREENLDIKDILNKNMSANGKYIYFCPPGSNLDEVENELKNIFKDRENFELKITKIHSDFSETENNKSLEEFRNGKKDRCRIILTVNKLNEGTHIKGIDGVLLGRFTKSEQIFFQQIGRALSVFADKNDTPLIIDLVGNIRNMKELMNSYKEMCLRKSNTKNAEQDQNVELEEMQKIFSLKLEIEDIMLEIDEITTSTQNIEFESRVKEVYDFIISKNSLPSNTDEFHDSKGMYDWIRRNRLNISNQADINSEVNDLKNIILKHNAYFFNTPTEIYNFKMEAAYNILLESNRVRKYNVDNLLFLDGSDVLYFITKYKTVIQEQKCIHTKRLYELITKVNCNFFKTEEELYKYRVDKTIEIIKRDKKVPSSTDDHIVFEDGVGVNYFIYRFMKFKNIYNYDRVDELESLIKEYHSKFLRTDEEVILERLNEIYVFLSDNPKLEIKYTSNYKLSTGVSMTIYLTRNKEFVENSTNPDVVKLVEMLNSRAPYFLCGTDAAYEKKLLEAANLINECGYIPQASDEKIVFLNNTRVGNLLKSYKNDIYKSDSVNAKKLVEAVENIDKNYFLSLDEIFMNKVEVFIDFIEKNNHVPYISDKEYVFDDGNKLGSFYLNNKSRFKNFAENERVSKLVNLVLEISPYYFYSTKEIVEKRLEYLLEVLKGLSELPISASEDLRFPDGNLVARFLYKRRKYIYDNKDKDDICFELYNVITNINNSFFSKLEELEDCKNQIDGIFKEEFDKLEDNNDNNKGGRK
ncbi:MAG: DEAD/DEAH box helicase family protein [bacterium]